MFNIQHQPVEVIDRESSAIPLKDMPLYASTRKLFASRQLMIIDSINFEGIVPHHYNTIKLHTSPIAQELHKTGIIKFEKMITNDILDAISRHFRDKQGYDAHVPIYSDGRGRSLAQSLEERKAMHSYSISEILKSEVIIKLITQPFFSALATNFLGCSPTLYSINCYYTLPNVNYVTHQFHRDYDDFRFLTFFLYLDDVYDDTGPFIYCPMSHLPDYETSKEPPPGVPVVKVIGEKGTVVVVDNYGLHSGSVPLNRPRFALWWRYGYNLNPAYWNDRNYIGDLPSTMSLTDFEYYLLRGFALEYKKESLRLFIK